MNGSAAPSVDGALARLTYVLRRIRWGARRIPRRYWVPLGRRLAARATGRLHVEPLESASVQRVVFVCHGNIMRSAFAHACWDSAGIRTSGNAPRAVACSAGTDARPGRAAHPVAVAAAARLGISLEQHAATPLGLMGLRAGDLLVGFDCENEVQLAARAASTPGVQVMLLGDLEVPGSLEAEVRDPWGSSEAQTTATFERIASLVQQLGRQLELKPDGSGETSLGVHVR